MGGSDLFGILRCAQDDSKGEDSTAEATAQAEDSMAQSIDLTAQANDSMAEADDLMARADARRERARQLRDRGFLRLLFLVGYVLVWG
ncbi:hypothetical protein [Tunturiibacter gelidoferens]|uniref:Uncharacterized protein n=2 Tax=Tunturiibacter gelidiferens TaxID=3069689 RepID=A0AAU7YZ32_9BACT|nr:hypothetical protein [Edaphobacter lichenicola]MBB5337789.1 hypothetical protein [Edaphobacter lichenicola]